MIDKLVEECSENIDGNKLLYDETLDIISSSDNKTSDSCVVYIILFTVFLIVYLWLFIFISFFI